jgi:hypothetical protein
MLLSAFALWSQPATTTQPNPAQTPAAYAWSEIIARGTVIGNRVFDTTTRYTNQIAVGDDGVIIGAKFPDPARVGVTGLYNVSASQVIVETGESINGSIIESLSNAHASDVQLDLAHDVTFLATFSGAGCANPTGNCAGLFIREHSGARKLLAVEVNGNGTYYLNAEGKITAPPGAWIVPPVTTSKTATNGADSQKKGILHEIGEHVDINILSWWRKGPLSGTVNVHSAATNGNEQQAVLKQQGQSKTAFAPDGSFKVESMPRAPTCAAPPGFPLPWDDLGNAAGPVLYTLADPGGFAAARYIPTGRPPAAGSWGRRVFFSTNCRPIGMSLWDRSGRGVLEFHTPFGLAFYLDQASGFYKFAGVESVAPPTSGEIDSELRISKRGCEILLPVTYVLGGKAVLRGRPLSMANCPKQ